MDEQQYQAAIEEFNRVQAEQVDRLLAIVNASHPAHGVTLMPHFFACGWPTPRRDLREKIKAIFPPIHKSVITPYPASVYPPQGSSLPR